MAKAHAVDIDDLDSGALSRLEDALQGMEAYVEKNGVRIDAMDEVRGYVDSILHARVEAITSISSRYTTTIDEPNSILDSMATQADGGLHAYVNTALISSLIVAQRMKTLVDRNKRR